MEESLEAVTCVVITVENFVKVRFLAFDVCACNGERNTVHRGRASASTSKGSHFYICLWPAFATSCSGPCRKIAFLHLAYGLCSDLALAISTTHPQDKYSFSFSCKNLDSKINVFL